MAIHEKYSKYLLTPYWTDAYKHLNYIQEEFNDKEQLARWKDEGRSEPFTGFMCDMRSPQPMWNYRFIRLFQDKFGWRDVGTSYYRMDAGVHLPTHSDLYKRYVELFDLQGQEQTIRRAVVFLEDSKPGHYAEICGDVMTEWVAGTVVEWEYDTPHAAANFGTEPRYTLQITGHV